MQQLIAVIQQLIAVIQRCLRDAEREMTDRAGVSRNWCLWFSIAQKLGAATQAILSTIYLQLICNPTHACVHPAYAPCSWLLRDSHSCGKLIDRHSAWVATSLPVNFCGNSLASGCSLLKPDCPVRFLLLISRSQPYSNTR